MPRCVSGPSPTGNWFIPFKTAKNLSSLWPSPAPAVLCWPYLPRAGRCGHLVAGRAELLHPVEEARLLPRDRLGAKRPEDTDEAHPRLVLLRRVEALEDLRRRPGDLRQRLLRRRAPFERVAGGLAGQTRAEDSGEALLEGLEGSRVGLAGELDQRGRSDIGLVDRPDRPSLFGTTRISAEDGIGGIATVEDALEFIIAGAVAVQVGTANFYDPGASMKIVDGLAEYCRQNGLKNIASLAGSVIINN